MQIEIYNMTVLNDKLNISLEAVCDSFSSLLWDIEYYKCGTFEVYIAASPRNIEIFQTGRIVGRDDDKEHFGLIESVELETDAEDGDYLIIKGRFLMCLLERRIIYPTFNFTKLVSYSQIVMNVVQYNACTSGIRKIPGLVVGCSSGTCWNAETKLQVSYDNLMEWVYTICEKIGGTANIRLSKIYNEQYEMIFELSQGTDRSILQEVNPHIIFLTGTIICCLSPISQIPQSRKITPMFWGKAKVKNAREPHILRAQSLLFSTATKCMLMQRTFQMKNRLTTKQNRFLMLNIQNF